VLSCLSNHLAEERGVCPQYGGKCLGIEAEREGGGRCSILGWLVIGYPIREIGGETIKRHPPIKPMCADRNRRLAASPPAATRRYAWSREAATHCRPGRQPRYNGVSRGEPPRGGTSGLSNVAFVCRPSGAPMIRRTGFPALTGRAKMARPFGPWDRSSQCFFDRIKPAAFQCGTGIPPVICCDAGILPAIKNVARLSQP
jgi:hypothetical protein